MLLLIAIMVVVVLVIALMKSRYVLPLRFTHSRALVTTQSLDRVSHEREQLLAKVMDVFRAIGVRNHFISDGNLLDYRRGGGTILQDDDIDIRVSTEQYARWVSYCESISVDSDAGIDEARGIIVSKAFGGQGYQVMLVDADPDLAVHADVVPGHVSSFPWIKIPAPVFTRLKPAKYLGVDVNVPDDKDTDVLLRMFYGGNYMKPSIDAYREVQGDGYVCALGPITALQYYFDIEADWGTAVGHIRNALGLNRNDCDGSRSAS